MTLLLIVNMKRLNQNTKVLVIAEQEESKKINLYQHGVNQIVLMPLSPKDITDKMFLIVSNRNLLENSTNDLV